MWNLIEVIYALILIWCGIFMLEHSELELHTWLGSQYEAIHNSEK